MNDLPYNQQILRHAAHARGAGALLPPPAILIRKNSPLCGDRVDLSIVIENGVIRDLRHDTRACVLCQAAISILSEHIHNQSCDAVCRLTTRIAEMLRADQAPPDGMWKDLRIFQTVAVYRHRHICVLLPFQAVLQACGETKNPQDMAC